VLVFDLADVAEALAQFERSSDTSQGATAQLVQLAILGEVFFDRCLCWLVVCTSIVFICTLVAALPLNMDDAGLHLLVPSVAEGCYEIWYHTLHQHLILACCILVAAAQHAPVAIHHKAYFAFVLPLPGSTIYQYYESSYYTRFGFGS
jgi:hypothetical protein